MSQMMSATHSMGATLSDGGASDPRAEPQPEGRQRLPAGCSGAVSQPRLGSDDEAAPATDGDQSPRGAVQWHGQRDRPAGLEVEPRPSENSRPPVGQCGAK